MAKKTKEYTFISYQAVGKAKWELYAYHDENNEKVSSFKKDGKKYTGNFCYGNRLVSTANGNILTGNKGFNTKQAAYKNVLLVGKVSGLIAGVTVKNGKRVDAVKSVKKKSTKARPTTSTSSATMTERSAHLRDLQRRSFSTTAYSPAPNSTGSWIL